MKHIYPKYYKDFKCIANKCPDSCCKDWDVELDDNGRYDGDPGPNKVDIYLSKAVDFDIKDLADNDFSISFKVNSHNFFFVLSKF